MKNHRSNLAGFTSKVRTRGQSGVFPDNFSNALSLKPIWNLNTCNTCSPGLHHSFTIV